MAFFLSFVIAFLPGFGGAESTFALAPPEIPYYNVSAPSEEDSESDAMFANRLKRRPIEFRVEYSPRTKRSLTHCQSLIEQALEELPPRHHEMLNRLTLTFSPYAWRGLGGENEVKIRCVNMADHELKSVFIHELGHNVDPHLLHGISFAADEQKKSEATADDFVSDYGSTNPYEDFAESYAYYVVHGEKFRERAEKNSVLGKKYSAMKEIFGQREYQMEKKPRAKLKRPYDVTVIGP